MALCHSPQLSENEDVDLIFWRMDFIFIFPQEITDRVLLDKSDQIWANSSRDVWEKFWRGVADGQTHGRLMERRKDDG